MATNRRKPWPAAKALITPLPSTTYASGTRRNPNWYAASATIR